MPYIMPKKNVSARSKGSATWHRMIRLWKNNESLFREHYHQRSNCESTVNMIKSKFSDRVRSKLWVAQVNEILCKIICHNLCCVIQEMNELGIDSEFCTRSPKSA